MPLITYPKTYRTLQLALSLIYLSLLIYASTHIGYWTNTTAAIILGSKSSFHPSSLPTHPSPSTPAPETSSQKTKPSN